MSGRSESTDARPGQSAQTRRGPGPHEARERAIGLLYEAESRSSSVEPILAELPLLPAAYALTLVRGVEASVDSIDAALNRHSDSWSVTRMPSIDRAILRVAVFELRSGAVPPAVVIDEAVELAKEYSTENSGRFVNGVLAATLTEIERDGISESDAAVLAAVDGDEEE